MEMDPRWEWVEVQHISDAEPEYIKGRCNHLTPEPVTSVVTGETLCQLCPDCDAQLPC